ncbi:PREDICTED: uncharacterized protein LOC108616947 isoform X2 [Drosophila arizonae]|uniref:Uncharacterized protein LOC108616947 isoform X1 n=1 Tax=Drosophila arizonae TaxID=7263 RepID=A0ABM1PL86_DROAR|nr:PREDICTED: uncharacterized protein LOC108616947 isoform X1 [Drosophila arizonae]XP_017867972.1 PREDICTED: uncharacterized protein LOC108616947 isoform X2 [Drosophila arizonae]
MSEQEAASSYEVKAPQGHTFVVSPVAAAAPILTAVPVMKPTTPSTTQLVELDDEEQPCCSSQAVVPLSSSLPSKLLRLHAKRSAQALLQQMESLDSQFGSGSEDAPTSSPSAPPMSPPLSPASDDKLLDVGMGSSIGDSEETEEDDELKPLAVDNHIIPEPELAEGQAASPPAVPLSEANLEKFRKHQVDNIYLHPNFNMDSSPPPAVAPANSPVMETKRVHRSFLSIKKTAEQETEQQKQQQQQQQQQQQKQPQQPVEPNEIDTLEPSLVPSDELAAEIADAVEFYFSNESILKDAFLLKHVRRNKEGFVSLKLVSSFKRVRQLTREWKVVGDAVRRMSRKIELNEQGTKVRRLEPLPSFDETMPSRTIVACDLPLDKLSIEKVSDLFSKCGEIALIRILKPGMAIPVDVRQFMNKYPELQQKECALVEYLESSSAREALHLAGPFQVYEMVAPKKKTGKKAAVIQIAAPVARMVENYRYYNDANCERTRGGSFSGMPSHELPMHDLRFKLKRNNSDFQPSYYQQQPQPIHHPIYHGHGYQHYQPRGSINMEPLQQQQQQSPTSPGFFGYVPRRYSNTSTISANTAAAGLVEPSSPPAAVGANSSSNSNSSSSNPNAVPMSSLQRRLSNCSEQNYGPDATQALSMSRRASNCSETGAPQRRDSNCSESCPCSRRVSDFGQPDAYRKSSVCSNGSCSGNGERRYSNGSIQFERTFSNGSDGNGFYRRPSNDFNVEREREREPDQLVGGGGGGYQVWPRRYSNNFQQLNSKLAAYDNAQYIGGRRISTDSGYDRRCSFGSEGFEGSPRSRTGSFLSNYKHGGDYDGQPRSRTGSFLDGSPRSRSGSFAQRAAESLVRTPIGPDGSKGFGQRARKLGQTVSPV